MKIVRRIKIGAHVYDVRVDPTLPESLFGRFNERDSVIQLSADMSATRQKQTFLHEIIEALDADRGIGLRHNQIDALESGLFQVITENPEVFRGR